MKLVKTVMRNFSSHFEPTLFIKNKFNLYVPIIIIVYRAIFDQTAMLMLAEPNDATSYLGYLRYA